MANKKKIIADYEKSELIAITEGKKAFNRAPWLFNRRHPASDGFFVELRDLPVNDDYCTAHCVDGNGTKLFLSSWLGNYRSAPIDGLAMNANDMATIINAFPYSLDLYIACQTGVEEKHMGEIMDGFVDGLEKIRIPWSPFDLNIGKIETASLDEIISLGVPGKGVDFGVVMTGLIQKEKIPNLDPKPGNVIVGITSSGMHSNGYTGARHVLLAPDSKLEYRDEWKGHYNGRFSLDDKPEILNGKTVGEVLREPTSLYLLEAATIGKVLDDREIYGVNITGNGLENFNRVGENVAFHITDPLSLLPVHKLLIQESGWAPKQSYQKQNNGMGFAYIAPNLDTAEKIAAIINYKGDNFAQVVGEVGKNKSKSPKTVMHKPYEGPKFELVGYNA